VGRASSQHYPQRLSPPKTDQGERFDVIPNSAARRAVVLNGASEGGDWADDARADADACPRLVDLAGEASTALLDQAEEGCLKIAQAGLLIALADTVDPKGARRGRGGEVRGSAATVA